MRDELNIGVRSQSQLDPAACQFFVIDYDSANDFRHEGGTAID
jgi:hypothetical protein